MLLSLCNSVCSLYVSYLIFKTLNVEIFVFVQLFGGNTSGQKVFLVGNLLGGNFAFSSLGLLNIQYSNLEQLQAITNSEKKSRTFGFFISILPLEIMVGLNTLQGCAVKLISTSHGERHAFLKK